MTGSDHLKDAIKRYTNSRNYEIEQRPGCVYGLITRDAVDDLKTEMARLRDAVTTTNRILIGLLVSIVLAVMGTLLEAWGP